MTSHYPDLGGASDWLKQVSLLARQTQIRVETRHQCGISALIPQTSFRGEMWAVFSGYHADVRLLLIGALRSDDGNGDGKEKVKKRNACNK